MEVDIHTHTIASGHAYSTLNEMIIGAKSRGIKVMCTTDHGPKMPGGAHIYHFHNLRVLPKRILDVRVLKGVEANVIDYKGRVDLPDSLLGELDFVIASFHAPCIKQSSVKKVTRALIKLMENPRINAIGHPEDARYKFHIKDIVTLSRETGTLLEVNNSSLLPTTFREGTRKGLVSILEECACESVPVVLGSDSHYSSISGQLDTAVSLIDEIGFPRELIMNCSSDNFLKYLGVDS